MPLVRGLTADNSSGHVTPHVPGKGGVESDSDKMIDRGKIKYSVAKRLRSGSTFSRS